MEIGKRVCKRGLKFTVQANENLRGWLYATPAFLPLLVFWIIPIFFSFCLSFTNWDMMSKNIRFVEFQNYIALLKDPMFLKILVNTFVFAAGSMVPAIVLGFLLALMLSGGRIGSSLFRTVIFAPYITPMIAVSIVWSWIFEPRIGILNFLLSLAGLPALKWTQSTDTAMLSVIIVSVWKQLGWIMVFYMEAIHRVPQSVMEAATIDGASWWKRVIHVIIPHVSPTSYFLVIIGTISSLQAYDQIVILTQGGPAGATRTLLYYYYQEAFGSFAVGRASAVAVFLVIITIILSAAETAVSKKAVHYD
jgi:multiple sugar transport system permease protein